MDGGVGMKPVCVVDKDAIDPEDVKKLESEGYLVLRTMLGRRCEILFPPHWMEENNGVH